MMTKPLKQPRINTWQGVHAEVLRRLNARVWKPGELLPHEVELAAEFGCARSTVNRALQLIAEDGLLERKRRGGTRVVVNPEHKATFSIPVIRVQVQQRGSAYGYKLLDRQIKRPPKRVRETMSLENKAKLLQIRAIHTADSRVYVLENRWLNLAVVPAAADIDFSEQSSNEWLVEHVPVSGGALTLSAEAADEQQAAALECSPGAAVFTGERITYNAKGAAITWVELVYAPGYRMNIEL